MHIPELEIIYGHYLTHEIKAKVVTPPPDFILNDSWLNRYDCAVLVSNDSDIAEALRLAKEQHNKTIGLIFPNSDPKRKPSRQLAEHADFIKHIRQNALLNSQLPAHILGTNIKKPEKW